MTESTISMEGDGADIFIVLNGIRIAKRGKLGTAQAGQWISLEPGYRVLDHGYPKRLVIEHHGVRIRLRLLDAEDRPKH
jgi:hypothetical protein